MDRVDLVTRQRKRGGSGNAADENLKFLEQLRAAQMVVRGNNRGDDEQRHRSHGEDDFHPQIEQRNPATQFLVGRVQGVSFLGVESHHTIFFR